MDALTFRTILAGLVDLDRDDLAEAGVISKDVRASANDWAAIRENPAAWAAGQDDWRLAAVWELIHARYHEITDLDRLQLQARILGLDEHRPLPVETTPANTNLGGRNGSQDHPRR